MKQRTVFAWTDVAKPGMTAWALVVCVAVAAGVSSLLDFADSGGATQIVLIILGVSLAGGLLLGRIRCEVSISDNQLVFRSRPVLGSLLNWPWTERRLARQSIGAFRLNGSAWTDPKLTIRLDDGSSLTIPGGRESASSGFDSFVAAFRSFAGGRTVQEDRNGIWSSFPIPHVIAGGVVAACGVFMILAVRGMLDQKSAMIVVIGGAMVAVAGVRFFLERG